MRVQRKPNLSLTQMLLYKGSNATIARSKGNRTQRDEYVHGLISPSITYSKKLINKSKLSRSVMDAINFNYMDIHRNHGESVDSITVNGKKLLKKDLPSIDTDWCSPIQAINNTVRFENGNYYKYTDRSGYTHTFACDHDRINQPYSDQLAGRQNNNSYQITKFWNMLSGDGTYLGLYFSAEEQKQMLGDAGIKEGFFCVESGSRKQEYYYSNGNAGVCVRKFEYDATYEMYNKRGSALFKDYPVGSKFTFAGQEYELKEDRTIDIPYGIDIFDVQFPKMRT